MTRPSRAAARRRAAEIRKQKSEPVSLPEGLEAHLAEYEPNIDPSIWLDVKKAHAEIMRRSTVRGVESFRHRCRDVAGYLTWRHSEGMSVGITEAMTFKAIDDFYVRGMGGLKPASRNDRRSRLRKLAVDANPSLDAPPRAATIGKVVVKAPYTIREEADIKRVALRQRNQRSRRNLCAIVGLCAGAGLSSTDLRLLRCRDITDLGDDGIRVDVPGKNPRTVWVRHTYEAHIRVALDARRPGELVIGTKADRSNITGNIIDKAKILGDVPHIEAGRLRSTWLAWLMTRPVPIHVILNAAGLKSARTLIDLLQYMPKKPTNTADLRGAKEKP